MLGPAPHGVAKDEMPSAPFNSLSGSSVGTLTSLSVSREGHLRGEMPLKRIRVKTTGQDEP